MQFFKLNTIHKKLTITLLLISIIPFSLTAYIGYTQARQNLEESVGRQFAWTSDAILTRLADQLYDLKTDVESWTDLDLLTLGVVTDDVDGEIASFLEKMKSKYGYADLLCVNGLNTIVASTDASEIGEISSIEMREIDFEMTEEYPFFVVPFEAIDGSLAVIVAKIFWQFEIDLIEQKSINIFGSSQSGRIIVVDENGEILISTETDPQDYSDLLADLKSREKNRDHTLKTINSEKVLIGYAIKKQTNWTAMILQNEKEALVTVASLQSRSFQIGTIVAIMTVAIAFLISRAFVLPILKLDHAASLVAAGDVNVSVKIRSRDEIGNLSEAFNVMVGNIRNSLAKLTAQQNYLSSSVQEMLAEIDKFTEGDLTVHLQSDQDDEICRLFNGFNKAIDNIRKMLQQVTEVVESTASASAEIQSSTEQLARGAEQQSAQSTEVAASIEQMAMTIEDNLQNAQETVRVARQSGEIAEEGGEVVQRTAEKMRQIADVTQRSALTIENLGKSSQRIGQVISVIEAIADQTNLLALNAAIEAARAGDQGRGFAVVADEVRKLAERTSVATQEIAEMINTVQNETIAAVSAMKEGSGEVSKGLELADQAGHALRNIVESEKKLVEMIDQIASSSQQQASTSQEIAHSAEVISKISSDSATGITEIARSTEDLSQQTEHLRTLIMQFRTGKRSVVRHGRDRPAISK